jgi:hypothetical protein
MAARAMMCSSSTTKMRGTGGRDTWILFRVFFRASQKRCQRGTRAGVLPIFTEPQNTEELLEGSMSLVLTCVLINFAHWGVINEDQELYLAARFLRKKKAGAI